MYELTIRDHFDAAHQLQGHQGKCSRLHGHTWTVEVVVIGDRLNSLGMLVDFTDLKMMVKECLSEFDHQFLNNLPVFNTEQSNPTAENLAAYVYHKVRKALADRNLSVNLKWVKIWEAPEAAAAYWEEEI